MNHQLKKLYPRYFQKSRSFLAPVLGVKKASDFPMKQCYMQWEGIYTVSDQRIILTYENLKNDSRWNAYLLELMSGTMFDEYAELEEGELVALSFDLHCIKNDYEKVLNGKYSQLSNLLKNRIREFYGFSTPEWAYMESFLYPKNYIKIYSKILDVDEKHILHTGELCDLPDLDKETLKLRKHAKINDYYPLFVEQGQNLQDDTCGDGVSLQ